MTTSHTSFDANNYAPAPTGAFLNPQFAAQGRSDIMKKPDISKLADKYLIKKTKENSYPAIDNMTHICGENNYYDAVIQFFPKDNKAKYIVISAKPKNTTYLPIKLYDNGEGFIDTATLPGIPVTDTDIDVTKIVDIAKKSIIALQNFYYEEIISKYEID